MERSPPAAPRRGYWRSCSSSGRRGASAGDARSGLGGGGLQGRPPDSGRELRCGRARAGGRWWLRYGGRAPTRSTIPGTGTLDTPGLAPPGSGTRVANGLGAERVGTCSACGLETGRARGKFGGLAWRVVPAFAPARRVLRERGHHVGAAPGRQVGPKSRALLLGNLKCGLGKLRLSHHTLTLKLQPTPPLHSWVTECA